MIEEFLNQRVVVDLRSEYVCLGTLQRIDEHFLELRNADMHDLRDSDTTRENYVAESLAHWYQTQSPPLVVGPGRNRRHRPVGGCRGSVRASGLFSPLLGGRAEVFSLPPCGGGLGWGDTTSWLPCLDTPHPSPPPQGGRRFCPLALSFWLIDTQIFQHCPPADRCGCSASLVIRLSLSFAAALGGRSAASCRAKCRR